MQAVVLSFDSLATNSLGCYGNEWIETPHLDRLASTGVVFDRHYADTIGPLAGKSWSNGECHQSASLRRSATPIGLQLKSAGVTTKFITAGLRQTWQDSAQFDSFTIVQGLCGADIQPDEVPIAELVKAGLSQWKETSSESIPRLLWLHSPGPDIPPVGFDSLYFEDFEERGQNIAELSESEKAQHPAVHAGAVSLVDHWVGELLTGIRDEANSRPTLVIVVAARGHIWHRIKSLRTIASDDLIDRFPNDQTMRTPLILNCINDDRLTDFGSLRSDRLVQTCDLVPTLLDWFKLPSTFSDDSVHGQSWLAEITEQALPRSSLWIECDEPFDAIRTNEWLCIRDRSVRSSEEAQSSDHASRVSLFLKPEDIWDVNNIASQQPEIVNQLLNLFPATLV